jgi:hypothetical protein
MIAPIDGTPIGATATGKLVGRRISDASISPIERTSGLVVSTKTLVVLRILKGAPAAVTSEAGAGTRRGPIAAGCGAVAGAGT